MANIILGFILGFIGVGVGFYMGAYITAKGFEHEQPFEKKKAGRIIRLTDKQKKQAELNKTRYKGSGDVSREKWGKDERTA